MRGHVQQFRPGVAGEHRPGGGLGVGRVGRGRRPVVTLSAQPSPHPRVPRPPPLKFDHDHVQALRPPAPGERLVCRLC